MSTNMQSPHGPLRAAILTSILICVSTVAFAASPLFEETELFVGGQDDISTYRIPSLITTANGTALAFCEGRIENSIDGSPTHLVLKRSTGEAREWNSPRRAGPLSFDRYRNVNMTWHPLQIVLASRQREAYMNPAPVVDRTTGAIYLLVNYYPHYNPQTEQIDARVWLVTSRDDGATWSKPADVTPEVGAQEIGPGIGIQLTSGRLVVPTYRGVIYSDDHGSHWRASRRAPEPFSESQVVELADGSLLRNTRSVPLRTITISRDSGLTWDKVDRNPTLTDSKLWDGCQASFIRYTKASGSATKNRLLYASPADLQYRFLPTVRLSYDEGKTWPVSKLIRNGTGAYSSMTVFPDGTIGLIYETGNAKDGLVEYHAKIAFARFNLEWLTNGEDHLP